MPTVSYILHIHCLHDVKTSACMYCRFLELSAHSQGEFCDSVLFVYVCYDFVQCTSTSLFPECTIPQCFDTVCLVTGRASGL